MARGVRDLSSVDSEEMFRFDLIIRNIVYGLQSAYVRFELDGMARSEFEELLPVLDSLFRGPGARAWWQKRGKEFNAEFQSFVNDRLGLGKPAV